MVTDELGAQPVHAAQHGLGEVAQCFGPSERLFDFLSPPLRDGVAGMAGGASGDGGMAGFTGHMWCDAGLLQVGDKVGAVIAFVCPGVSRRVKPGEWRWIISSAALRSARPSACVTCA